MRLRVSIIPAIAVSLVAAPAIAQTQKPQGGMQMPMPGHQHEMPMPETPLGIDHVRDGSGTSWLPDDSPMHALMHQSGRWMLMLHGNGFLQFLEAGSERGDDQFGSVNWVMGMAQHELYGGQLTIHAMFSAEPATIGRCGYPSLLQSGESCRGALLHDRQHPHDLFMELAADYRRSLNDRVAIELYGGPAGEPALGPTSYPHRFSALPNLFAPITHHWLDSSHISFGVFTGGLYGRTWKAEASIFNGREPDDGRYDVDADRLDSYSGRLWLLPTRRWAFQVSAGHLKEAEVRPSGPREDVDRVTASITYHRLVEDRLWATTIAWGRNREEHHATSGVTAETAIDVTHHDLFFVRGEVINKTSSELVLPLPADQTFTVGKIQTGYTRWLSKAHGERAGIGVSAGVSIVPGVLTPFYGSRTAGEFAVYLTLGPH